MKMLCPAEEQQLIAAFRSLPIDAPVKTLTEFIGDCLSLNPSQLASITPDSSLTYDSLDSKIAYHVQMASILDYQRQSLIRKEARIPPAVLIAEKAPNGAVARYLVLGLCTYLRQNRVEEKFLARLSHHDTIRTFLTNIGDGFKLEALTAALLQQTYPTTYATKKSSDQGVDIFSNKDILEIDSWCCMPDTYATIRKASERLHIIASCKANEGNSSGGIPATITPAHARELIGAWLIQRTGAGIWQQRAGVKLLSPMQLLLITTYRLSDDTLQLCRDLGVAVWSITELIYLICRDGPDQIFPGNGASFNSSELETWLEAAGATRI